MGLDRDLELRISALSEVEKGEVMKLITQDQPLHTQRPTEDSSRSGQHSVRTPQAVPVRPPLDEEVLRRKRAFRELIERIDKNRLELPEGFDIVELIRKDRER